MRESEWDRMRVRVGKRRVWLPGACLWLGRTGGCVGAFVLLCLNEREREGGSEVGSGRETDR